MARFFFNFFDGVTLTEDEIGVELASVELAYLEAGATAQQMWPELLSERVNPILCAFDIANERGDILIRFEFVEVIDPVGIGSYTPAAPLEIMCSDIARTHRRAQQAKAELDESMSELRQALDEAKFLLEQFSV